MASRILRYEFRKTRKGTRLLIWGPLERGGKTVLADAIGPPGSKPSALMDKPEIIRAIPERLRKTIV